VIIPEVISNEAGLKTLFRADINETYHSIHGAAAESLHVFIEAGLQHLISQNKSKQVQILEVGFGTGLNAMLSLISAQDLHIKINYCAYETIPLPFALVNSLNYSVNWPSSFNNLFEEMHANNWNQWQHLTPNFSLLKLQESILLAEPKQTFDLIYFDAFAPDKQSELWTIDLFKKLYSCLNPGGVLVSYTAKGQVRRNLLEAGFRVERIAGPPRKRHMVRASKLPKP